MNVLLILIPISVVLLGLAIWAFIWAVKRGQFDDLDTPALDILADEQKPARESRRNGPGVAEPEKPDAD